MWNITMLSNMCCYRNKLPHSKENIDLQHEWNCFRINYCRYIHMFYGFPTLVYTGNYRPHWSSYFVSNNRAFFLVFFVFCFLFFFLKVMFFKTLQQICSVLPKYNWIHLKSSQLMFAILSFLKKSNFWRIYLIIDPPLELPLIVAESFSV